MGVCGWIYVITNKAMPGLIKVGYTLKDPVLRANELYNTGSPHSYVVQYEVFVHEPREIEQRVHSALSDFKEAKEQFTCSLGDAVTAIRKVIGDGKILLERTSGDIESAKGKNEIIRRDHRFIAYDNGTVLDTRMYLMWAANDNESDINWVDAKFYCENYRGGGYTDWRMPTQDELAALYYQYRYYKSDPGVDVHPTNLIRLTSVWVSSSKTDGSWAYNFDFNIGSPAHNQQSALGFLRALPVRSDKQVICETPISITRVPDQKEYTMLHEKFSSELFIKRTKKIMNQYLEKCSKDPDIFYDITLSINCLYGLLMMPAQKYYKKLPNDEVHSYLKRKGIDETEISVTSKLINGNKQQSITFKKMLFGIRNGLAHWEEKYKKLDGTQTQNTEKMMRVVWTI